MQVPVIWVLKGVGGDTLRVNQSSVKLSEYEWELCEDFLSVRNVV